MKRVVFMGGVLSLALLAMVGCKTDGDDGKGTKVLMIGNSFSLSCLSHLPQVAADRGVDLDLAVISIGGCTLKRHVENLRKSDKGFRPYSFVRNRFGKFTANRKVNLVEALEMAEWDIVAVQQASSDSWKPETYQPYGQSLVARIRELAPKAKIVVQETWSPTPWDYRLKKWGMDQNEMYDKLHSAYEGFAKECGLEVVPMGTAVQEWRKRLPVEYTEKSFGGDVVGGRNQSDEDDFKRRADGVWEPNSDVFHLNEKGEYLQALVWASKLFGVDLMELEYKPDIVTESEAKLMREIAMDFQ